MLHCSMYRSALARDGENMDTKEAEPSGQVNAAAGEQVDIMESMTQLYISGIERLAEIQKKGLEFAVQHNAQVVSAWKKHIVSAPSVLMLDLATTTFERAADTQKGAIDLVVEQTHALAGLVKERKVKATATMEEGKTRVQEAIDHTIAAQKTAIDYSAKQVKVALEAAKHQLGIVGTPVGAAADSMQRGMDVVVEAQKELLDVLKGPVLH
jgi:hypothetical protein